MNTQRRVNTSISEYLTGTNNNQTKWTVEKEKRWGEFERAGSVGLVRVTVAQ